MFGYGPGKSLARFTVSGRFEGIRVISVRVSDGSCSPCQARPHRAVRDRHGSAADLVAVRCPRVLAPIIQAAGRLVEHRRTGPVIRALERATDPLFRQGLG